MTFKEFGREPPIKEGQTYNVKISSMGTRGDGMAKINGFCIFIPETNVGEKVNIKITKVLPKVGFGKVIQYIPEEQEYIDSEDFGEENE